MTEKSILENENLIQPLEPTAGDLKGIDRESLRQIHKLYAKEAEIFKRILSRRPQRICDDEKNWPSIWRKLLVKRTNAIRTLNSSLKRTRQKRRAA